MIKLKEETRTILTSAIPNWMHDLCAVNFNIQKIDESKRRVMENNHSACFIGELHNGDVKYVNARYVNGSGGCETCYRLSMCAPIVFNSSKTRLTNEIENIGFYRVNNFGKNTKGKQTFLDYVANHIRESHMNLIKTKVVENEC